MSASVCAAILACLPWSTSIQDPAHDHAAAHRHEHAKHPTTIDARRFLTSRNSDVVLPLPEEKDAFFFVVYGDRTGGYADGIEVLKTAVTDTNLLEPDLVMTVGDLIQGYNTTQPWLEQMREFKQVMSDLKMPWFPVAGNHDIYWRGENRPAEEHEGRYEIHFGPLWYAFEHKNCWFLVLYSDEPNPQTGERNFDKVECQRMSAEQHTWLRETLKSTKDAQHVFVFIHHPRWLAQYGDDWEKVHTTLSEAGNVSAVFGGHIHKMRYDGKRDGIEYLALATVGGHQWGKVPEAGYLNEYHIVTVRESGIAVSALPVGEVIDARAITGEISRQARLFDSHFKPKVAGEISFDDLYGATTQLTVTLPNPIEHDVEFTVLTESLDPRWVLRPDHAHLVVRAGTTGSVELLARHPAEGLDSALDGLRILALPEFLAPGMRFALPPRELEPTVRLPGAAQPAVPFTEHALRLDGHDDWIEVDAIGAPPLGAFSFELWLRADDLSGDQAIISGHGHQGMSLRLEGGAPILRLRAGSARATARSVSALSTGHWHHVAAAFDRTAARLYVDGSEVARAEWDAPTRPRVLPCAIGAGFDRDGGLDAMFSGYLDSVLFADRSLHRRDFQPRRRAPSDVDLALNMDAVVGRWLFDDSPRANHPRRHGEAIIVPVDDSTPR